MSTNLQGVPLNPYPDLAKLLQQDAKWLQFYADTVSEIEKEPAREKKAIAQAIAPFLPFGRGSTWIADRLHSFLSIYAPAPKPNHPYFLKTLLEIEKLAKKPDSVPALAKELTDKLYPIARLVANPSLAGKSIRTAEVEATAQKALILLTKKIEPLCTKHTFLRSSILGAAIVRDEEIRKEAREAKKFSGFLPSEILFTTFRENRRWYTIPHPAAVRAIESVPQAKTQPSFAFSLAALKRLSAQLPALGFVRPSRRPSQHPENIGPAPEMAIPVG